MANNDLTLALTIKTMVEGSPNVKALADELKKLGVSAKQATDDSNPLNNAFKGLDIRPIAAIRAEIDKLNADFKTLAESGEVSLADLGRAEQALKAKTKDLHQEMQVQSEKTSLSFTSLIATLGTLSVGTAAITAFGKASLESMQHAESGFKGLESVSKYTGNSINASWAVVTRYTKDGLVSVADASKALQNLLSRGYDIKSAENVLNRLKDSAAFNRQASLSLSEAVVSATEGLKNENSMLVDNDGVTKNVSKMWEEYAQKLGRGVQTLSQAEKVQAEINGIMHETEAQLGNAAKAADSYQGSVAKLGMAWEKFKTAFGGDSAEDVKPLVDFLGSVVELLGEAGASAHNFDLEFLSIGQTIGTIVYAIANGKLSELPEMLSRNYQQLQVDLDKTTERYEQGLTPAMQQSIAEGKKVGPVAESAAKQAADAEARFTAAMTQNGEKLKLAVELLEQAYQRQNQGIAAALAQRLGLIDASNAAENVKAQQKEQAEAEALGKRLELTKLYEAQRLKAVDDAYSAELGKNAQGEAQKEQITKAAVEARKEAYASLATAYSQVVADLSSQFDREMGAFNQGNKSIQAMAAQHEQDILAIRRSGMSARDALDSEEKERDQVLAKLREESAKGSQADQEQVNKLYERAKTLITDITRAKQNQASDPYYKEDAAYQGEKKLNEAYAEQQKALTAINKEHKENADKLLPSINEARIKVDDMNKSLGVLDQSLAQSKKLNLELAGYDKVRGQLDSLLSTEVKTIVVKTVAAGSEAAAAAAAAPAPESGNDQTAAPDQTAPAEGHRWGGLIRALASGGRLPGYGGGDKIPLLGEGGEFMVRKESVQKYGVPLFEALNAGKFASGGMVGNDSQAYQTEFKTLLDSVMSPIEDNAEYNAVITGFNPLPGLQVIKNRLQAFIDASPASMQQSLRDTLNTAMQGRIASTLMGEKSFIAEQNRPGSPAVAAGGNLLEGERAIGVFQSMMSPGAGINRDAINRQIDLMTNKGQIMPNSGQAWLDMAMQAVAAAKVIPANPPVVKGGDLEPPFAKGGQGGFPGGQRGLFTLGAPLQPIQINSPQSGKAAIVYGAPSDHKDLVDMLKFHAMTT